MKNLLERKLAGALQVCALFSTLRDDASVIVGEQAHGFSASDIDAEDRHYRYITCMIVLSGADVVLPDRVLTGTDVVIEGDRIVDLSPASRGSGSLKGHVIVPGFVDVHVHGVDGIDSLDGDNAIERIAGRLCRYGVTSFCPTTVACPPQELRSVLDAVSRLRDGNVTRARILPAHLESNFINPEYKGAQPTLCLRKPPSLVAQGFSPGTVQASEDFSGADILAEIERGGSNVAIVTLAPELDGALDLIRHLVSHGCRVSLGHSGATLDASRAAIAAGARHATHLFNRMRPLHHREPGLAGAVLTSAEIAAEVICDGVHVHPHMVRLAIAAKSPRRVMAITDGVAAAGLPEGASASLGGRPIRVENSAAYLGDGTLAGSVSTMDRVFRFLVQHVGLPLQDAGLLCATTAASELGLRDIGVIAKGAIADLAVLDSDLNVQQTYVAGRLAYEAN